MTFMIPLYSAVDDVFVDVLADRRIQLPLDLHRGLIGIRHDELLRLSRGGHTAKIIKLLGNSVVLIFPDE